MYSLGIDIGSITAKAVVMKTATKSVIDWEVIPTGYNTKETAQKLVNSLLNDKGINMEDIDFTISTGYSRKNVEFSTQQITEISCQAKGIYYLFPLARTVIDIGGQDSKAIKIDNNGHLTDFEMNDKCSAGTGRFLEVMARSLEVPLEMMDQISSPNFVPISSTCTVFAESEVVSRIAQGANREAIIGGIHESIANKVMSLVGRVGIEPEVVVTGGVAKNRAVVKALEKKIKFKIKVPDEPQITGAMGAALIAIDKYLKSTES